MYILFDLLDVGGYLLLSGSAFRRIISGPAGDLLFTVPDLRLQDSDLVLQVAYLFRETSDPLAFFFRFRLFTMHFFLQGGFHSGMESCSVSVQHPQVFF